MLNSKSFILPITSVLILITGLRAWANLIDLAPGFAEPLTMNGTSGGPNNSSDCGFIPVEPNHTLEIKEPMPYLRLTAQVQSQGTGTMLIEGAMGRFCLLPDGPASGKIQLSGYVTSGTYKIYIGDRTPNLSSPYSLSISQQQN